MPELPEVEAVRRAIHLNCIGKKIIRSVIADDVKVIVDVSRSDFEASLTGKTIVAAHRKGKHMWIQLDSPPFPSFQFGLTGEMYIKGVAAAKYKRSSVKDIDNWPSKYSKFFIELDDGLEVSFTDKIRFARVRLLKNPAYEPPIFALGPDALLEPMTEDELFKSMSKKKTSIKKLILDQGFISGVGNWIADEVLYQSRIHPLQIASSISKEQCAALHKSLKEVIEFAVEVNADYDRLPADWLCHSRWGKKPGKINGHKIEFIEAGGRTSAYVPELQKLSEDQAAKITIKTLTKSSKKSKGEADEAESEDEEIAYSEKPKRGNRAQSNSKRPPIKRKSHKKLNEDSDDDDEDYMEDEVVKGKAVKKAATTKKTKGSKENKKPSARKKSQENEDESESDDSGIDEEWEEEKRVQVKGKMEVDKKVQAGGHTKTRAK
uniref:formamidopyrimidine-DNA glycosylase-like n=1 Tax=Erigeron canadensis TaxID=72917 RepID=UPI001CB99A71|nr:formamidopyrimidine-DNA glycosylase-like [Erigeron canadensis]